MLLQRAPNSRRGLVSGIVPWVTPFSAHDLGADTQPTRRVAPAKKPTWTGVRPCGVRFQEIRGLQWPFATLGAR
jgi:hypothetical protein